MLCRPGHSVSHHRPLIVYGRFFLTQLQQSKNLNVLREDKMAFHFLISVRVCYSVSLFMLELEPKLSSGRAGK